MLLMNIFSLKFTLKASSGSIASPHGNYPNALTSRNTIFASQLTWHLLREPLTPYHMRTHFCYILIITYFIKCKRLYQL